MKETSNIKVIEKTGDKPGKNVIVLAGVHGNESFGVKMINELLPNLKIISGKVTFIFANLEAIKQNKRFIEFNLNRCFLEEQPKEIENSLEGRTAREIMPYLEKADIMLDIHASFTKDSVPFIICQPQSFDFTKILPFDIVSWNWDEFEPGSTDYYMNLQNKIGICVECGFKDYLESISRGKIALNNFLKKAGIIEGGLINDKNQKFYKIVDLYKNKNNCFKKSRDFSDFEKLKEKTFVGKDGNKEVYVDKDNFLLFVTDVNEAGEECFLVAKETLLNKDSLNKLYNRELK